MGTIRVSNVTRDESLVTEGRVADTAWTRLKGLIGSAPLEPGEGLLIVPCQSIHTHFMGFPSTWFMWMGSSGWWGCTTA